MNKKTINDYTLSFQETIGCTGCVFLKHITCKFPFKESMYCHSGYIYKKKTSKDRLKDIVDSLSEEQVVEATSLLREMNNIKRINGDTP